MSLLGPLPSEMLGVLRRLSYPKDRVDWTAECLARRTTWISPSPYTQ